MSNEELVQLIQGGDRGRMAELWAQVERFISMQAGKCARALEGFGGVEAEDLYQSGYLALVAATDSFDPTAGRSFISWLALALKTAFAEVAGYRTSKREALDRSMSLDKPVDEEGTALGELQEDPAAAQAMQEAEDGIWREQLSAALERAMEKLPAEQRDTLRRRYYDGQTRAQIATESGVYPETARQRELKALRTLRGHRELRQFVEAHTNYYMNVSARTGERTVEVIALRREELAQKWSANG